VGPRPLRPHTRWRGRRPKGRRPHFFGRRAVCESGGGRTRRRPVADVLYFVIHANAGTQRASAASWVPAFAGMTKLGWNDGSPPQNRHRLWVCKPCNRKFCALARPPHLAQKRRAGPRAGRHKGGIIHAERPPARYRTADPASPGDRGFRRLCRHVRRSRNDEVHRRHLPAVGGMAAVVHPCGRVAHLRIFDVLGHRTRNRPVGRAARPVGARRLARARNRLWRAREIFRAGLCVRRLYRGVRLRGRVSEMARTDAQHRPREPALTSAGAAAGRNQQRPDPPPRAVPGRVGAWTQSADQWRAKRKEFRP